MQAAKKATKGADAFFKAGGAKEELSATRKADQKTVDTAVCHLFSQTVPRHGVGRVSTCVARLICTS